MDSKSFKRVLKAKYIAGDFTRLSVAYWLSDNYLVEEYSDYYSNYCKKIELSKIQAFTCVKNLNNLIFIICFSIFALITISLMLVFGSAWGFGLFFALAVLAIFVVAILVKLKQGSSCKVYIHTAVNSKELVGVYNISRANKFFKEVNFSILKLQGEVDIDGIVANIDEASKIVSRLNILKKLRNRKKDVKEV